jgi:hypothetical protein
LNDSTLDGYLARILDQQELHRLDDHVAGCLRCTLVVEAAALDEERWERRGMLGRLAPVTPPTRRELRDAERIERAA